MIELGVFLPVLNNGWIVSTAAPQYQPSYAMNKAMTRLAENLGFRFVLSPVKYRGFGGPTEQWDYVLESFEVMAALAGATDRIRLYGSVALPTVHPAITARRAATIDHISHGRFGINLVSGWQRDEYEQMGLWPGDAHYQRRYRYAQEYVDILKLLWTERDVDYEGEYFHLRDCRILPHPERPLPLVCAGQSDVGMRFTAQHADYAFVIGDLSGDAVFAANRKLRQFAAETGRDVGAYVLYTLVLAETEAEAQSKSDHWMAHADRQALTTMMGQAALDALGGTAAALQGIAYLGITPIIASYEQCAAILDRIGSVPGTKGIMLIFPECLEGLQTFGERVLPLMCTATLAPRAPHRSGAEGDHEASSPFLIQECCLSVGQPAGHFHSAI
jgi:pyrimidine oxygenase